MTTTTKGTPSTPRRGRAEDSFRYGSVCSGIEAASVAWEPLGWEPAWFSEIEPFPSLILAHRWPGITNHGDFTRIHADAEVAILGSIDLLVGGTPCQSFSVAGLRKGLADPRGNLALEFLRLADRLRPEWLVWENVPGVLSSHKGRDFGSFLGALGQLGYGWAYRVLDAQYVRVDGFGRAVPQRRRRVFVVGYLGDWRPAVAVLFDRESLSGHPAPRRQAGQETAPVVGHGFTPSSHGGYRPGAGTLRAEGGDIDMRQASRGEKITNNRAEGSTGGAPGHGIGEPGDPAFTVSERGQAIAFMERGRPDGRAVEWQEELAYAQDVKAGGGAGSSRWIATRWAVRRLTPFECEALQGFPGHYTLIPMSKGKGKRRKGRDHYETVAYLMGHGFSREDASDLARTPDGPRYRALGNSMAVNVMRWIGWRIDMVRALLSGRAA